MLTRIVSGPTKFTFAYLLFAVLLSPPAWADTSNVVTIDVSGTAMCNAAFHCSVTTISFTGTYHFDPDTEAIVGAWTFTTPFGTSTSSGTGAFTQFFENALGNSANDFLQFGSVPNGVTTCGAASCVQAITLILSDPDDAGPLVPGTGGVGFAAQTFDGVSGTATVASTPPPTTVPEPGSMLLLGTGLTAIVGTVRHKLGRQIQACQARAVVRLTQPGDSTILRYLFAQRS